MAEARNGRLKFMRLDLTDQDGVLALFAIEKFDTVCHLAAQAGVRYSISDPFARYVKGCVNEKGGAL